MKSWEKRLNKLKKDYLKYLNSDKWKSKSKRWRKGAACEKCGSKRFLTAHHKHYKTFRRESRKDIVILCWKCHKRLHQIVYFIKKNKINEVKEKDKRWKEISKTLW